MIKNSSYNMSVSALLKLQTIIHFLFKMKLIGVHSRWIRLIPPPLPWSEWHSNSIHIIKLTSVMGLLYFHYKADHYKITQLKK